MPQYAADMLLQPISIAYILYTDEYNIYARRRAGAAATTYVHAVLATD